MPENNEQRAELEAITRMAAAADKAGLGGDANIDLAQYLKPSQAQAVPDKASNETTETIEEPVPAETKTEPERAETETAEESEETKETEETEEIAEEELTPAEKRLRKDQARLAKNFKEFQQEKQESREEVRKMREELAQLRGEQPGPTVKDERGHTAKEWEDYAEKVAGNGDIESYKIAQREAQILRQKEGYAQFVAGWQKTQAEVVKENPDLTNMETPLAKEVTRLLSEPQSVFKMRPDGLKYAVAYAKANLDAGSISALKGEIKKLKQELTRLNELSSVAGDKPHRMSGVRPSSFDTMDAKDQLETLRRKARELDDMRTSG